jgi:hypothetical protein
MLKWLIRRRLDAFEREYGYDVSYARAMLAADTKAILAYAKIEGMGRYRRDVPPAVWFAVKITGVIAEDCGPCTQLGVTMARRAGVPGAVLAAVLAGDDAAMPEDVRLGVQFARASLAHSPDADPLREQIVARWGERAVIALAFALASAKVYPTVKYALGFGKTCQRVVVDDKPIAVVRSAA